jgi:aminobenzoyl-glutamate utilization protein B
MSRRDEIEQLVESSGALFEDVADQIWGFAELCYQEHQSAALQKKVLSELGFQIQDQIPGMDTAFIASWGHGHPVIAILGEYDALSGLN